MKFTVVVASYYDSSEAIWLGILEFHFIFYLN